MPRLTWWRRAARGVMAATLLCAWSAAHCHVPLRLAARPGASNAAAAKQLQRHCTWQRLAFCELCNETRNSDGSWQTLMQKRLPLCANHAARLGERVGAVAR